MTAIKRNLVTLGVFVGIVGTPLAPAYAQTCKTNIDVVDPATKQVCATWDGGGDPELLEDFTIDYLCDGCSDAPEVKFATADDGWELYSEVISTGAPANLGHVLLADDVSPNNGIFAVAIKKVAGAGADKVASIVLDSADASWTGHSSIASGSKIAGDLGGPLKVVPDGSYDGGELAGLIVYGDVEGPITVPHVTGDVWIAGDLVQGATIGEIVDAQFYVLNNLLGNIIITGRIYGGRLLIGADVPLGVAIQIADIVEPNANESSGVQLGFSPILGTFAGVLILDNGLTDADSFVQIRTVFTGTIDLRDRPVAGDIYIVVGWGDILNGGALSGTATLGTSGSGIFSGDVDFASVSSTGTIESQNLAGFAGRLLISGDMEGEIYLDGGLGVTGFAGSARISVSGSVSGDITIARDMVNSADITLSGGLVGSTLIVEGDVSSDSSTITIADMVSAGGDHSLVDFQQDFAGSLILNSGIKGNQEVRVGGEVTSTASIDLNSQAVAGTLKVSGGGAGAINSGGAVSGTVILADGSANTYSGTATFASVERSGQIQTLNGAHISGQLNITADCSGDIDITGDLSADIDIGGDLEGDLAVDGDMTSTGSTTVDGMLGGSGRILVGGQIAGPITVGEKTGSLTLIQIAEGLATGATIEINTSQGVFDAEGDIHIGVSAAPVPLPFDGCIRIYEAPFGGGGNLRGDLQVVACHDDDEVLMICIDGSDGGNVSLVQTGCDYETATWGCPSPGCP